MKQYTGSCHCGSVQFSFEHVEIKSAWRCNCSLCRRKGAVMSKFTLKPDLLKVEVKNDALQVYQFGTNVAQHYFCNNCGIYPFHQPRSAPNEYRINLGCLTQLRIGELETGELDTGLLDTAVLDTEKLQIDMFDGKNV